MVNCATAEAFSCYPVSLMDIVVADAHITMSLDDDTMRTSEDVDRDFMLYNWSVGYGDGWW